MFNYNTDQTLWENYRKSRQKLPNGGAILMVIDGHINNGIEYLARFDDDTHARKTLLAAGYKEISPLKFK